MVAQKKKRLLIIPAKGYSKRIKEKNIKKFFGKPVISYILKNAKKSNLFEKIHVSTESRKVMKIVEKLGFKTDFLRPKKLSKDRIPTVDVLRFVYNRYLKLRYNFDEVWTISSCTPLLKKEDLIKASKKVKKNKILLSVTKYDSPIEWAFSLNNNGKLKPVYPKKLLENSQKFSQKYHDAGAFAVFPISFLKKTKINLENNFIGFVLPKERAIDVDYIEDWKLTELLFKAQIKR
tara:strand:+ start:1800 stop:2501 length:702 start_codon:yes stop_codon:yes gene_type:complete